MKVKLFMIEVLNYRVMMPIEEYQRLAGNLSDWLKSPVTYYVVLFKDNGYAEFFSEAPIKDVDQKVAFYFSAIEYMWCGTIYEIEGMIRTTAERLPITECNTVAWRLIDTGIEGHEFDYKASEMIN